MTNPDFRALCAELVDALKDENTYTIRIELIDRARAALAQPEPVAPTDEELLRLAAQAFDYAFVDGGVGGGESEFLAYARAVLARWGQPAATPIPVAERLPGPKDLDREGTCWMFHPINLHYCLCVPDPSAHTHWLPANALYIPEAP